jgi:catechol 2,3-dioxygenase-like lactoylglutathione lyase family enzyme
LRRRTRESSENGQRRRGSVRSDQVNGDGKNAFPFYTLIVNKLIRPGWALTTAGGLLGAFLAHAHVPYIEGKDYPEGPDFVIHDVEQSKAFYAYLDADDADGFEILLDAPDRIYVSTLIPFCREYAYYDVNFALIGPGLPATHEELPVEIPAGQGAVVHIAGFKNWAERPFMYEMFSDRKYFEGRGYTQKPAQPGTYRFVVWHGRGEPGDYIAIIGRAEEFGPSDMQLAVINTPIIRRKEEMRSACEDSGNFAAWFDRDDIESNDMESNHQE